MLLVDWVAMQNELIIMLLMIKRIAPVMHHQHSHSHLNSTVNQVQSYVSYTHVGPSRQQKRYSNK